MTTHTSTAALAVLALLAVSTAAGVAAADHEGGPDWRDVNVIPREGAAVFEVVIEDYDHEQQSRIYFEYRETGAESWKETNSERPDDGAVNQIHYDGLQKGTEYETRAVIAYEGQRWHTGTVTFTTEGNPPDDGGDDGWIKALIDALNDLPGKIVDALAAPFDAFAKAVTDVITGLIVNYPQVHPNEDVTELHRLTLTVALAVGATAFIVIGLIYQTGGVFGVSADEARRIIPRLLTALVFATVSPQLLQLAVDFFHALTVAFQPTDPGFWSAVRLSGELILVSVVLTVELLMLVLMLVVAKAYIVFAVVASPLIAVAWAFPYSRQWAQKFIATFYAMLAIGPVEMLLVRINLAVLETSQAPDWLLSLGLVALMVVVPYMLWSAAQAATGGYLLARGATRAWNAAPNMRSRRDDRHGEQGTIDDYHGPGGKGRRPPRRRRYR